MKICGCIIAKNEERCIARCINSYKEIADEIIVVDTGSTDKTVELAKEAGARVVHFDWIDDFAAAKNFALDQLPAGTDWVIFLDADEYFRPGDAPKLLEEIKHIHGNHKVRGILIYMYNITPKGEDLGDYTLTIASVSHRVLRWHPTLRYIGSVHEYPDWNAPRLTHVHQVPIDRLLIMHDGYQPSLMKSKQNRNLELLFAQIEKGEASDLTHYYIGQEYFNLDEFDKSVEHLWKYIESGNYKSYFGLRCYVLCRQSMQGGKYSYEERARLIAHALEHYPNDPTSYYLAGEEACERHEYDVALRHMLQCEKLLGSDPLSRLDYGLTIGQTGHARVLREIAKIYEYQNDIERALEYYHKSIALVHTNPSAYESILWCIRYRSDTDKIAYLQSQFDLDDLEELERILSAMRNMQPGMAFLALFEQYFAATNQQDLNFITMLSVIGEYAQAANMLLERYKSQVILVPIYLYKALVPALLSGSETLVESVLESAKGELSQVIGAYRGGSLEDASANSAMAYLFILRDLINLGPSSPVLQDWLAAASGLPLKSLQTVLRLLAEYEMWDKLRDLCDGLLERTPTKEETEFARECAYQGAFACCRLGERERMEQLLEASMKYELTPKAADYLRGLKN